MLLCLFICITLIKYLQLNHYICELYIICLWLCCILICIVKERKAARNAIKKIRRMKYLDCNKKKRYYSYKYIAADPLCSYGTRTRLHRATYKYVRNTFPSPDGKYTGYISE